MSGVKFGRLTISAKIDYTGDQLVEVWNTSQARLASLQKKEPKKPIKNPMKDEDAALLIRYSMLGMMDRVFDNARELCGNASDITIEVEPIDHGVKTEVSERGGKEIRKLRLQRFSYRVNFTMLFAKTDKPALIEHYKATKASLEKKLTEAGYEYTEF